MNDFNGVAVPDDARFAYIVRHEAYYWSAIKGFDDRHSLMVQAAANDGGVYWEFQVDEYPEINCGAIRVCVFGDAFAAYAQIPGFFASLVAERPSSLDELRTILDRLGAVDLTDRTDPHAAAREG